MTTGKLLIFGENLWEVWVWVKLKMITKFKIFSLKLNLTCESVVTKSCLVFCDPMDCSPPGFSVHEILQAKTPEWLATPFSRGYSWPGIKPGSPTLQVVLYCLSHQGSPSLTQVTLKVPRKYVLPPTGICIAFCVEKGAEEITDICSLLLITGFQLRPSNSWIWVTKTLKTY